MAQKNDQVFPVSLSEIAFMLVFVLMLLLGVMITKEHEEREKAEAIIARMQETQSAEAATAAMNQAKDDLTTALQSAGTKNPLDVIDAISQAGRAAAERDHYKQEVIDLNQKLVALEAVRGEIEKAAKGSKADVARELVEQALVLRDELKKAVNDVRDQANNGHPVDLTKTLTSKAILEKVRQALNANRELHVQTKEKFDTTITPGDEPEAVRNMIEKASASGQEKHARVMAENEKLRTQVAFYENRDKLRGLDHPPCWMDKDSRIEYIFAVQTSPAGPVVVPAWLDHRSADAKATAGYEAIMAKTGTAMSNEQFIQAAKPYLDYGKKQTPECRHFVYLSSTITDADRRDQARRLVSSYFYISERKNFTK